VRSRNVPRRQQRRRLRLIIAGVTALACLATSAVAWIGVHGLHASEHLRSAGRMVGQLQSQIQLGDTSGARTTLSALKRETQAARAATGGFAWRLGGHLPVVGSDLAAVRTVAVAVDDFAQRGLSPLAETAAAMNLGALAPKNGRIDVAAVQAAAPRIAQAAAAARVARDRVDKIRTEDLFVETKAGVAELRRGLDQAVRATTLAQRVSTLLPAMLGADRPRTYLLLFQNPAEIRATGGMPGAYLVLGTNRGQVQVVDQGTAAGLGSFSSPVLPLDPSMKVLYTERLGIFPADINLTPHFPTAAALAREMYRRHSGRTVDGVLATDPVALSYLLAVTGPIPMPVGEPLTAANAVHKLLSEVYNTMTQTAQDRYFATAARGVFDKLTGQSRDVAGLVRQLSKAVAERRFLVWSADSHEQVSITGTTVDGELPITDRTSPTVGVFLNDGTGAKLGYYLTYSAELSATSCRSDGSRKLHLRVTLGSTAPKSALSKDVTGLALAGGANAIRTNVSIFSPTGGTVMNVRLDRVQAPLMAGTERRRWVSMTTVELKPGQSQTVEADLLTGIPPAGAGPTLQPRLWTSPGVNPWKLTIRPADDCYPTR
jgi:hypothetical protein